MFTGEYSRLTKGINSYSDIKDIFNEIEDRIGKEAASYVFALYSQLDPTSYVKSIYDEREDISDVYEDAIKYFNCTFFIKWYFNINRISTYSSIINIDIRITIFI